MGKIVLIPLVALGLGVCAPASAQDAAETAVILSGTGAGQAQASHALGDSISNSINSAADVVRSSQRGGSSGGARARRGNSGGSRNGSIVIGTGDPLEGTDASSYTLGNGTGIKVSGRLRPSMATRCEKNCDTSEGAGAAPAEEQPTEKQPED